MSDAHTASRREDLRLITGRGKYVADINLPGQLHAGFLRSDRAHAEIVSIDASPALKRPGVVAVFTGADAMAAGYKQFPNMMTFTNRAGGTILKPDRPVLADGKVRFVGEAVAMVVAESALAAQDALDFIEVEYRDLPHVVTVEDALAAGAPQLHASVPGNLSFDWDTGDAAAVEQAFAKAAHVARVKVSSPRVVPSPMELRGSLISYDAKDDSYDVYTNSQGIVMMRWQFAALTGVAEEKLRFHLHDVGGSFGQRSAVYPEHGAQMIAARKLGRPIKWIASRSECFLSDSHGRGIEMAGELALDSNGKFLAARYKFLCDMGAYLTPTGPASHVRNPAIGLTGVYRIPALHGNFKVVFTNTAPIAAYRGAGRPDVAYVVERLVDRAARDLKIDRDEIRRRNFIPLDAFPYKTPTMGVYEASDFAGCLGKALKAADWTGFERRREVSAKAGKLRGIGLSTVIEGTAAGMYPKDQVAFEFDAQGRLDVYTVSLSTGQSHETTFVQIIADTLGIAAEGITLRESVQGKNLIGNHSGGSRSLVGAGSVCKVAAQKLIEQARPLAAEELELEPSQVDYAEGLFSERDGDKSISLLDLAKKLGGKNPHPLNLVAEASVGSTFPNGCHIAEVEIDPATGVTTIASYTAVDDAGTVINHSVVEGQVHGGVAQGAGQVFGEHAVYDRDSGQLLSGSFSDYTMPRAGWVREIHVNDHPLPSKVNVLGAKGAGESGCTASLPSLVSAALDALRPLGIGHIDMPLTPSRVWQAIQSAQAK
jgi:aerobic carbon-monoxide dehydrogenase large subunit